MTDQLDRIEIMLMRLVGPKNVITAEDNAKETQRLRAALDECHSLSSQADGDCDGNAALFDDIYRITGEALHGSDK